MAKSSVVKFPKAKPQPRTYKRYTYQREPITEHESFDPWFIRELHETRGGTRRVRTSKLIWHTLDETKAALARGITWNPWHQWAADIHPAWPYND
jgi:hypothetical protein